MPKIVILLFVFCLLTSLTLQVSVQLIHADSLILNDTLEHRYKRWDEMSSSRYAQHVADLDSYQHPPYYTPLEKGLSGLLLAQFQLGATRTIEQTVVDTGSGIMWVACQNSWLMRGDYSCEKSETCVQLTCLSNICDTVPRGNYCPGSVEEPLPLCTFETHYRTGLTVDGTFVLDKAFFGDDEDADVFISFGCGKPHSKPPFDGTGVMGMMNGNGSLASQFDGQFSLCLENLIDPDYKNNKMVLGNDAVLEGMSTPILDFSSKIYVKLQKILVDGKELDIDPAVFEGSLSGGGTLIDTGSPFTYLVDVAYTALYAKLDSLISGFNNTIDPYCRGSIQENQVPKVIFVFDKGAQLRLGFNNLFVSRGDNHCFIIKPSSRVIPDGKMSVIGILAQQNHIVGYDYKNMQIFFWPDATCNM